MATSPMLYRSIVALNRDSHRKLKFDQADRPYAFASKTHLIPAVIGEFARAQRHLPILFVPGNPQPAPVFLVGVRPGHNAFVDSQGRWRGDYVPAFARRYPFMLGETLDGGSLACIDDTCLSLNQKNGDPLFAEDGSESPFLQQKIRLITDYFGAAKRTDLFTRTLNDLRLLQPVTIEAKALEGGSTALHGLMVVGAARLNEVSGEDLANLRNQGFLAAIYAHIFSLDGMDALREAAFGTTPASPPSTELGEPIVIQ
jgi:SapC